MALGTNSPKFLSEVHESCLDRVDERNHVEGCEMSHSCRELQEPELHSSDEKLHGPTKSEKANWLSSQNEPSKHGTE